MNNSSKRELAKVYEKRFGPTQEYRQRVWAVLASSYFQKLVPEGSAVLDLGCGYGHFINAIKAGKKFGLDLNPDSGRHLQPDVTWFAQDSAQSWPLADGSLDVVFSSNFFEHLPDKAALSRTLAEAFRCLKPGGRLIAVGPNLRVIGGSYWDFWDHYLPLTDWSLCEGLVLRGFEIRRRCGRFLPYTMAHRAQYPLWMLRMYLGFPLLWRIFGGQFLIVAVRPLVEK